MRDGLDPADVFYEMLATHGVFDSDLRKPGAYVSRMRKADREALTRLTSDDAAAVRFIHDYYKDSPITRAIAAAQERHQRRADAHPGHGVRRGGRGARW